MDQRPLRATKPRRGSNRMKKLRATNHVTAAADAAKASIIGSGIKELSLPHVSPPPPQNVAQQAVWLDDSTNADINWWSPLGQYVLGALSYAAMKGEPVPSAVHLYRSIEARRDEAKRKGKEASDKSLLATSPPAIDSVPIPTDKAREAWCEVCKIDCSSKRSLNDHLPSKRHEKNLLKLNSEGTGPAITEPQGSHTLTSLDKSITAPEVKPAENQQVDVGPKSLETAVDDVTDNNHSLLAGSTQLPSASIDDKSASSPLELPVVTAPSPPVIDGCTALPVSIDIAHKAWCEVCKIDCCTKSVLDDHLLGKRHKKNLLKLQTEGIDPAIAEPRGPRTFNTSDKPINAIAGNPESQEIDVCSESLKSAVDDVSVSNHSLHATSSTALPGSRDKPVIRTWCEVCKIGCSKKSDLDEHLLGKRHKKNLMKMASESVSPPSTIAAAASTSTSSDNSNRETDGCSKSLKRAADDVSAEDIESKRGKVLSCGAYVQENATLVVLLRLFINIAFLVRSIQRHGFCRVCVYFIVCFRGKVADASYITLLWKDS